MAEYSEEEQLKELKRKLMEMALAKAQQVPEYIQPKLGPEDEQVEAMVRSDLLGRQAGRKSPLPEMNIQSQFRDRAQMALGTGLMGDAAKFGVHYAKGPGESTMPEFEKSMLGAMDYRDKGLRQVSLDREAARGKDITALKYLADMRKGKWSPGGDLKGGLDLLKLGQPVQIQGMKDTSVTDLELSKQSGAKGLEGKKQVGRIELEKLKAQLKKNKEDKDKITDPFKKGNYASALAKEYQDKAAGYQKVKLSVDMAMKALEENTPTGELTALYAYIKVLDPETAVREGEVALNQSGQSALDRFMEIRSKVLTGTILSDKQVRDLKSIMPKIADIYKQAHDKKIKSLIQRADAYGVPWNQVGNIDEIGIAPGVIGPVAPQFLPQNNPPPPAGPRDIRITGKDGSQVMKKKVSPEDIQKLKDSKKYKVEEL